MGYRAEDFITPWAKYFDETMPPIQTQAIQGLENSPFSPEKLPPIESVTKMLNSGYAEVETGYAIQNDGAIHVAILTKMPRVSPRMWDWWFGWHGCRDNRYKLWHPKAHKSAKWQDGSDKVEYIGRTSMIQEFIGKTFAKANIRFINPNEFGLNNSKEKVFICARVGYTNFPINFGWLIHQVRATNDGAEMRSRFWMGGKHIEIRKDGKLPRVMSKILQKTVPTQKQMAKDLLIHCAEEMNHLAQFLPEIYQEFAHETR